MSAVLSLVVCVLVCFAFAGLGGWATASSVGTWYQTLRKPSWNPPDWLFGPVWTLLYLSMAVALWLVLRRAPWPACRTAVMLFAGQLALNAAWSWLFFGLRRPDLAAIEVVGLWLAIAATLLAFRPHSPVAAGLMVPYLAWVSFATVLNITIWRLNLGVAL
ncbi:MAG: tryptophan-rich sensory protein [Armatimonadetes bacterium]|nr:tryptophan-rich sensory protein [Armatimonadota bacterium]